LTYHLRISPYLVGRRGYKGPEGKSKLEKDKILRIKPRDASLRDPLESDKRLLGKKQEGLVKMIKQDLIRQ
jgi:hypothetical protein